MAEDDSMGMTIWTMLSSQLGPVLLVVAYFGESQNSELRARKHWTDKICLARPKISTKFVSAKFYIW